MSDDLDAYLNSLPDKLVAELSDVIREQAERLSEAQRDALRSMEAPPAESGDLEASCVALPTSDPLEYVVQAGGELTTREVRTGSGVDFDYALAFEYGTTRQHAKPFFWPTYDAMRDDIAQAINQTVEKVLK
jgi:hypothetical protein